MIFSCLFPPFSPVLFFFLFSSIHLLLTWCKKGEEGDLCGFLLSCSLDDQSSGYLQPHGWSVPRTPQHRRQWRVGWGARHTHLHCFGPLFSTSIIHKALLKNWNNKGITEQGRKLFVSWEQKVKVTQSYLTLQPHGLYSPWNSPSQNTGVGSPFPSPEDLPNSGIKSRSPALQADSSPAEPPGKPKNDWSG